MRLIRQDGRQMRTVSLWTRRPKPSSRGTMRKRRPQVFRAPPPGRRRRAVVESEVRIGLDQQVVVAVGGEVAGGPRSEQAHRRDVAPASDRAHHSLRLFGGETSLVQWFTPSGTCRFRSINLSNGGRPPSFFKAETPPLCDSGYPSQSIPEPCPTSKSVPMTVNRHDVQFC